MANCKDCLKQDVCNRDVGHGYSVCPCYLSADVEIVRHGEWEVTTFGLTQTKKVVCTVCGYSEKRGPAWDISWGMYNYCPSCGAKMDGNGGAE